MLRFSCEKALLQAAVSTASRAVSAKSSIPALEGILLEGEDNLTLSGYNMQTGIRTAFAAEIHEAGRIVLTARLFSDIIRKLPDDIVVFSADERLTVHLTCGDASFDIQGLSADDFPELPEVDDEYSDETIAAFLDSQLTNFSTISSIHITSSDCTPDLPDVLLPRLYQSFHSWLWLSVCVPTVLFI